MKKAFLLGCFYALSAAAFTQTCDCKAALNYAAKKIEANYSGFKDKVTPGNQGVYNLFTDSLRAVADMPVSQQQDSCVKVLRNWISFFKDGHVGVGISLASVNIPPDSVRAKFSSWPVINYIPATFAAYLAQNKKTLKPLEGIWQNEDGNYKTGIIYKDGKYSSFILKADSVYWMPGQLKFEIIPKQNVYEGTFYMRDHSPQNIVYNLQAITDGVIEAGNLGRWYKLDDNNRFVFKAYYPGSNIVSFKKLSGSTNLLIIKSFDENYRKIIDSIITANDNLIRSTDNLIIDVRGNGGGSDVSYYPLRKYLFTNPYKRYGAEILATNDNIQKFRELTTNPNFSKEEQEGFRKRVTEMEKSLNKYWSSSTAQYLMSDTLEVLPFPKKIAVLIDKGCGSTTEQFLLNP